MAKGTLDYKIKMDTSEVHRKIAKMTKAIEAANQAMRTAQAILNAMYTVSIVVEIAEKKKRKWYQFWKR